MTNKEYKQAREIAETVDEVYTFEKYNGRFTSRYMDSDDARELRNEYKEDKKNKGAFALQDFKGRAIVIPTETGYLLKSYYTIVAEINNGEFIKRWEGYSNTTLNHINAFRRYFNLPYLSKREWIEM